MLPEAADTVHPTEVPEGLIQGYKQNETFLRKIHHILLEVAVLEGTLHSAQSLGMCSLSGTGSPTCCRMRRE